MRVLSGLSLLISACAALAWAIAFGMHGRRPTQSYRPVAWLSSWALATSLLRAVLQIWVLHPARAAGIAPPYPWPERAAFFADGALELSWPCAILGAALTVFGRRSPLPGAALWATAAAGLALAYPVLRGDPRLACHAAVALLCCLCCWILAGLDFVRQYRARREWSSASFATLVLSFGVAGAWARYLGGPDRSWTSARIVQGTAFSIVLIYNALLLWVRRRGL